MISPYLSSRILPCYILILLLVLFVFGHEACSRLLPRPVGQSSQITRKTWAGNEQRSTKIRLGNSQVLGTEKQQNNLVNYRRFCHDRIAINQNFIRISLSKAAKVALPKYFEKCSLTCIVIFNEGLKMAVKTRKKKYIFGTMHICLLKITSDSIQKNKLRTKML